MTYVFLRGITPLVLIDSSLGKHCVELLLVVLLNFLVIRSNIVSGTVPPNRGEDANAGASRQGPRVRRGGKTKTGSMRAGGRQAVRAMNEIHSDIPYNHQNPNLNSLPITKYGETKREESIASTVIQDEKYEKDGKSDSESYQEPRYHESERDGEGKSSLRRRRRPQPISNDGRVKHDRKSPNGRVNLVTTMASFIGAVTPLLSRVLAVADPVVKAGDQSSPISNSDSVSIDVDQNDDDDDSDEERFGGTNRGLPIFRSEVGKDVSEPLDYPADVEKFTIRSDWRKTVLAPAFRSDMGYAELPQGALDDVLMWMICHWKKSPSPEDRTILMAELKNYCAMLLRKHNVKYHVSTVEDEFGLIRRIEVDPSHQVHALVSLAVDIGEPLFYASEHPIPKFYVGWPLFSLAIFIALILVLVLPDSSFSSYIVYMILLFTLWFGALMSVQKNQHWYYYVVSPELRFQFGSRR